MQSDHREHQRRGTRRLTCEEVAAALPGIVDGNDKADRQVEHHVATCLRCQAELVHYRKLLKALRQLRTEYLEPAPGVLSGILANLGEVSEQSAIRSLLSGRRAAYIGGVAVAATAAAGAGTLVLVSRASHRRKGMPLAG
jgi:anti-sigma factor RsiW